MYYRRTLCAHDLQLQGVPVVQKAVLGGLQNGAHLALADRVEGQAEAKGPAVRVRDGRLAVMLLDQLAAGGPDGQVEVQLVETEEAQARDGQVQGRQRVFDCGQHGGGINISFNSTNAAIYAIARKEGSIRRGATLRKRPGRYI